MAKQIVFLLIATILIVLAAPYVSNVLHFFVTIYHTIHHWFSNIFASGKTGATLSDVITLFIIPGIITGLIALVYWFAKRSNFPYFTPVLWGIWLVVCTAVMITLY